MKNKFNAGWAIFLLGIIACQPVFAIGWREILLVLIVAVFLLGPPLYRFLRRLENFWKQRDK